MKVLVGLLRSPQGLAAMERAAAEARVRQAQLHVVGFVAFPLSDRAAEDYDAEAEHRQRELDDQVRAFVDEGIDAVGHLPLGRRRASAAILEVAEAEAVDLIVIGVRRRSRVGKAVLGSNAQDILLGADCPVLAVHAGAAGH